MGRVRNRLVKRSARKIVEKHYDYLCHDFQTNKQLVSHVAEIQGKRLRNQIAGYVTRLVKRVECGPVRGICLRIHEKERNIPENISLENSVLFRHRQRFRIDDDTKEMLKILGLPNPYE
ncbi:hypothetical protein A3Q56_05734 [Intoshia linei]|uniref:40S ribosomal protein S17 n=1 Tax=Intoshia linei TaxID=1819745 RepID=A0A177AYU3_9BILA|nr:hypothetical protein A3Q56_05734 [Intoshia linei]